MEPINCPLCKAPMTYTLVGKTHSWDCTECPAVLLECEGPQNLLDLLPAKKIIKISGLPKGFKIKRILSIHDDLIFELQEE